MQDQTVSLIDELGLQSLPGDVKNKLIATWAQTLQDRVVLEVMETLTEEEKGQFNQMAESASDDEINKFLREHVPDLDVIIQDQFEILRREVLEQNNSIRETVEKLKQKRSQQQ
jgi:hypothetical protein